MAKVGTASVQVVVAADPCEVRLSEAWFSGELGKAIVVAERSAAGGNVLSLSTLVVCAFSPDSDGVTALCRGAGIFVV